MQVNHKGMVTLPKAMHKKLKAETKGQVVVQVEEDQITLQELPMSLKEVCGSVTPLTRPENFKKLRQVALEEKANFSLSNRDPNLPAM